MSQLWLQSVLMLLIVLPGMVGAGTTMQDYWTYQEFESRYAQKQTGASEYAARVRAPGEVLTTGADTPVRIAVVYPGKQVSDYWRRSVSSFEARLKESRIPYEIRSYFSKPGKEIRLQTAQINEALSQDPDYLIFTLDALKHRVLIERLIAKKRPRVILQNITTPLKQWGDTQPFLYVGFDHAAGTELLAEAYQQRFSGKGRYAIFYGPRGYVSQMRGGTFKALMAREPDMELLAEYYTGFDRKKAYGAAMKLLTEQPQLDFIYSCSTDIALGVVDAIKELGKEGEVITNGWGGGSSELAALASGGLDLTVMRMNDDNGAAMAEAILWQLQGKRVPNVYSGDIVLMLKEMSTADVGKLSSRAFRYSGP